MTPPAIHPHLLRLSALIDLEQRARAATPSELPYLMVNDTLAVVPCQQAAFWRRGRVAAISGVASGDEGGPYHRWLARTLSAAAQFREPDEVDADGLGLDAANRANGSLPPHSGCHWSIGVASCAGGAVRPAGPLVRGRVATACRGRWHLCAMPDARRPTAAALVLIPVRASMLAPAEIVAAEPLAVRAPFDGVVDAIRIAAPI